MHHSQEETLPFGEHDGDCYGEVHLKIEPNRELHGRILQYGESLEVMQPRSLRDKIEETLKKMVEQYEKL